MDGLNSVALLVCSSKTHGLMNLEKFGESKQCQNMNIFKGQRKITLTQDHNMMYQSVSAVLQQSPYLSDVPSKDEGCVVGLYPKVLIGYKLVALV
jgi:hypothetical protein